MGKSTILVADDEQDIRLLVNNLLGEDYIVLEASNGEEAVNIARIEKPDLILMDIMMPKVDGYTACHALKIHPATKEIPVVMLTGIGHRLNKKLAEEIGAQGYVTKPFRSQELLEVIGGLLSTI